MEWVASLRASIDYMEAHLTDDIGPQDVAKQVYLSPFFFQRGFSLITGYGVGEYLRNRRLYQAALDLKNTDGRVIDIALRYGKPLIIAETSTAFTLDECNRHEGLERTEKRGLAANEKTAAAVPYPMTPAGQCQFLQDLAAVIRQVPNRLGRGLIWWEPAWLPVKGSPWATDAALRYIHETGPGGNEWANQALFDYDGAALPALELMSVL